ncbi:MAG: aldo/keto reductase [Elusimicrobia bacterium]|nr:aldo/keto reductase [Elusimicrobiota bacterium]
MKTQLARRRLGRTGFDVSEIGFGGWGIGKTMWGRTEDGESSTVLRRALELGVNYFDTAFVYGHGHSERLIGQALRDTGQSAVVATAVPPKNMEWPARASTPIGLAFPPEWIEQCTDRSLAALRVERLDLQQLHVWHDAWLKDRLWPKTLETLGRLKRDGKVRFWAVSVNSDDPDSSLEVLRAGVFDAVQVSLNLFDQRAALRLLPLCAELGIGVVARCPFDEGGLTGSLTRETRFEPSDFRSHYFGGERLGETVRRADALRGLLVGRHAESLAQAALKFCLSFPAVGTVIPGMRRRSHVEENVRAADGRYFDADLLGQLREHAWVRNFYA